MSRPTLIHYDVETAIATFRGDATYCIPGLTAEAAEHAVREIKSLGRRVHVVLEFEDTARPRARFRNGRPTLRAVADAPGVE